MKFAKHTFQFALALALYLGSLSLAFAQVNTDDPLGAMRNLIQQNEIVLTYSDISVNNSNQGAINGLAFDPSQAGTSLPTIRGAMSNSAAANVPAGVGATATAAGFLLGENYGQGVVRAYVGKNGTNTGVYLTIELFEKFGSSPEGLATTNSVYYLGNVFVKNNSRQDPDIDVIVGNFDTDTNREIVVLMPNDQDQIEARFYDVTIDTWVGNALTLKPVLKQTVIVGNTTYDTQIKKGLAGAATDMDSDGVHELAVIYSSSNGIAITFQIMRRQANGDYAKDNVQSLMALTGNPCGGGGGGYNWSNVSMDIAAGEMNPQMPGDELVVAAHFGLTSGVGSAGNNKGLYIFPLGAVRNSSGFQGYRTSFCQNGAPFFTTNDQWHFSDEELAVDVATGDLDGDMVDEAVVAVSSKVMYFDGQTNTNASGNKYLTFNQLGSFNLTSAYSNNQIGGEARFADDFLDVGNIDPLTGNFGADFREEILIAKNFPLISDPINGDVSQKFELTVYGFNTTGAQNAVDLSTAVVRKQATNIASVSSGQKVRHFSAMFADLNGGSVVMEYPTRTDISEVLSASLVLNAPPAHFDVLGNQAYDVNNLYKTGEAPPTSSTSSTHFRSIYEEVTSTTSSFSTTFNSDWAIGESVSAGLDLSVFNMSAKIEHTYGEKFSQLQSSTIEKTITNSATAFLDDQLLAYMVDYAVLEYPVSRVGENTPFTHVVVVVPTKVDERFVSMRNPIHTYRPSHQFANLFSYPSEESDLEVYPLATNTWKGLKSVTINKNGGVGGQFSVTQDSATSQSVETTVFKETSVSASAGGAFKGIGLNVSVQGDYSTSSIQNSTLDFRKQVSLKSYLGQGELATIPGDYPYTITPMVYWSEDGALILDYLVDISKFEFWKNNYDSYDPAFLLLDPHKVEKQLEADSTYNSSDRFRTRDIYFEERPQQGQTTTIYARVFNYGFLDIPADTLDVAFYYNDPDGLDTLVHIATERIPFGFMGRDQGLGKNVVSTSWAVPADLGPDTKVVAIIDPNNQLMGEIHDYPNGNGVSNNIGWTCAFVPNCNVPTSQNMFFPGGITSTEDLLSAQVSAYPNPFENELTLDMDLLKSDDLTISVFNLQGQVIFQEKRSVGAGPQSLSLTTTSWPAGMYVYQIKGNRTHSTGKVVLRR
ncbi:MAG: T9SS type A sorting domain-containing protein [Bacteroidota bacterium]